MKFIIKAPSQLNASINLPASKSISNRALVISAMAGSNIQPDNLSDCDDTEVIMQPSRICQRSSTSKLQVLPCDS